MRMNYNELVKQFAHNMRELMEWEEVSYTKLAMGTDIARSTLVGYGTARHVPNIYHAAKIAEYLDVTVDELIGAE